MRVLVTGATGFVGSHLLEYALAQGADVWGLRRSYRSPMDHVAHIGNVRWLDGDLTDAVAIRRVLAECWPDRIFHLAAQSFVPDSWRSPMATVMGNVGGTLNLLEAVRALPEPPRVVLAGSSEEYGRVEEHELPITEAQPLRPLSPYAVSKVGTDLLGAQYHASYGLPVVRLRCFNTTGPRRGEVFMSSSFAKQLAEGVVRGESIVTVHHGNLDAVRDLTDVRDVVRAYWLVAERGVPGEVYNIASGVGAAASTVLDMLARIAGVGTRRVPDPARMRPSDVPRLIGDASRAQRDLRWSPSVTIQQTLADLYHWWRDERLQGRGAPTRRVA